VTPIGPLMALGIRGAKVGVTAGLGGDRV
jgi:hypothetical protein